MNTRLSLTLAQFSELLNFLNFVKRCLCQLPNYLSLRVKCYMFSTRKKVLSLSLL